MNERSIRNDCIRKALKTYAPYMVLLILMFIFHFPLSLKLGDDAFFSKALADNSNNILSYLYIRWNTWSSRLLIETLEATVIKNPILWKILNITFITLLIVSISEIADIIKDRMTSFMLCNIFLLFPLTEMANTGWGATTINQLWPVSACAFVFATFKKKLQNELSKKICLLSFVASIFAVNAEQICAVLFAASIIFFIYKFNKSKTISAFFLIHIIISITGLLLIFVCPGNQARKISNIIYYYPNYGMLSLSDKLFIGIQNLLGYIFMRHNLLLIILCILLFITVHQKEHSLLGDIVAGIPLAIFITGIIFCILKFGTHNQNASIYAFKLPADVTLISLKQTYLPVFLGGFAFISIIICFYILFGSSIKAGICILILCSGIATCLVLAFSPTVYASGVRIFFYFNMSLIMLIAILLKDIRKYLSESMLYTINGIILLAGCENITLQYIKAITIYK